MPQMLKCVILQVGNCGKLRRVGRSGAGGSIHGTELVGKALNQDTDV